MAFSVTPLFPWLISYLPFTILPTQSHWKFPLKTVSLISNSRVLVHFSLLSPLSFLPPHELQNSISQLCLPNRGYAPLLPRPPISTPPKQPPRVFKKFKVELYLGCLLMLELVSTFHHLDLQCLLLVFLVLDIHHQRNIVRLTSCSFSQDKVSK